MMEAVKQQQQQHHHKHSTVTSDGGQNPIALSISGSTSDHTVSASPSPSSLSSSSLVSKNRRAQEVHNNASKSQLTVARSKIKTPVLENGAKLTNAILFDNNTDNNNLSITNHNKSYQSSDLIQKASNGFNSTTANSYQQHNNHHQQQNHQHHNHHFQKNNTNISYQASSYNRYNQNHHNQHHNHHQHHNMSYTARSLGNNNNRGHNNSRNHHSNNQQSNHHHHNSNHRQQRMLDDVQLMNQMNTDSNSINDPVTGGTSATTASRASNQTVDESSNLNLGPRPMTNDQNQHRTAQQSGPPHYVELHVNAGERLSLQLLNGQQQEVSGPITMTMVSQKQCPPVPVPIQAPPGHMVHQIVDENGTLKHIILSVMANSESAPTDSAVIYLPQGGFRIDSRGEFVCAEAPSELQSTSQNEIYSANFDACTMATTYDTSTVDQNYPNDTVVGMSSTHCDAVEPKSCNDITSEQPSSKDGDTKSSDKDPAAESVATPQDTAIHQPSDSSKSEGSGSHVETNERVKDLNGEPVDGSTMPHAGEESADSSAHLNMPTSSGDMLASTGYQQSLGDLDYMGPNMIGSVDSQLYCYQPTCCCCCYCDPMGQQDATSGAIDREVIVPMGDGLIGGQSVGVGHQSSGMVGYPAPAQGAMMDPTMAMGAPHVNEAGQMIMNGATGIPVIGRQPNVLSPETHGAISGLPNQKIAHGKSARSGSGHKQYKTHSGSQDRSFGASGSHYGVPYSTMASGHQYVNHRASDSNQTSSTSYRSQGRVMAPSSYSSTYQKYDHLPSSTSSQGPNSKDGNVKIVQNHSNRHNSNAESTNYSGNYNRTNTDNTSDNSFMHRNSTKDQPMSYAIGQSNNNYNMVQASSGNNRHNNMENNTSIGGNKRHQQLSTDGRNLSTNTSSRYNSKAANHGDSPAHGNKISGPHLQGSTNGAANIQSRSRANKGNLHGHNARVSSSLYQQASSPTAQGSAGSPMDDKGTRESSSSRHGKPPTSVRLVASPQDSSPSKRTSPPSVVSSHSCDESLKDENKKVDAKLNHRDLGSDSASPKTTIDEKVNSTDSNRQSLKATKREDSEPSETSRSRRGNRKAHHQPTSSNQTSPVTNKSVKESKSQLDAGDSRLSSSATVRPDSSNENSKSSTDSGKPETASPLPPSDHKALVSKEPSQEFQKQASGKQTKPRNSRDKTGASTSGETIQDQRDVKREQSTTAEDTSEKIKAFDESRVLNCDQSVGVKAASSLQDIGQASSIRSNKNPLNVVAAHDYLTRRRSMTDEIPQVAKKVSSSGNESVQKISHSRQSQAKNNSPARQVSKKSSNGQKSVQSSATNQPATNSNSNKRTTSSNKNQRKSNDATNQPDDHRSSASSSSDVIQTSSSSANSNHHLINSNNLAHSNNRGYNSSHNNQSNQNIGHNHHNHNHHSKSSGQQQVRLSQLMKQCRTRLVSFVGKLIRSSLSTYSDSKFAGLLIIIFTIFAMLLAIFIHLYIVKPVTE